MTQEFWEKNPAWLSGTGEHADVVLASRIRFARNLKGIPFPAAASADALRQVVMRIEDLLNQQDGFAGYHMRLISQLSELERMMLMERRLISPAFARKNGQSAVVFDDDGRISWMVNEEDHLRLQILDAGLNLEYLWEQIHDVEQRLDRELEFAFSEEFGYLTSCPTNTGTGLRVSVLVHIPALELANELETIFNREYPLQLTVRGFYGEGSDVVGSIFQISNKLTLGWTEFKLLNDLLKVVSKIVDKEREARKNYMANQSIEIEDRVFRSLGVLKYARKLSSREYIEHYSNLMFGADLGLIQDMDRRALRELLLWAQPGHLQWQHGKELTALERDVNRAELVRRQLGF